MKVGFTTLSMFMDDNVEIIKKAHKYAFDMIEILGESPFFKKKIQWPSRTAVWKCQFMPQL